MPMFRCLPPLLLLVLLLPARQCLGYEPAHLSACPTNGLLALNVPEDLPVGAVLFTWDPARLRVRHPIAASFPSSAFSSLSNRPLGQSLLRSTDSARAFFGVDLTYAVSSARHQVRLTMPLPVGGPDQLQTRFRLACRGLPASASSSSSSSSSSFHLRLRLLRRPLRLAAQPPLPELRRGSPAGAVVANVTAFARGGRPVQPEACRLLGNPAGRPLAIDSRGRLTLVEQFQDDAAAVGDTATDWTVDVACQWQGERARLRLRLTPLRIWRRRQHVVRFDFDPVLSKAGLRLSLDSLLARRCPQIRLLPASRTKARLLQSAWPLGRQLLVDLPSTGSLTVRLEATDRTGSSEIATLRFERRASLASVASLAESTVAPACQLAWWLKAISAACAVLLLLLLVCLAVGCCLRGCRRRGAPSLPPYRGLLEEKPQQQFV